MIKEVQIHLVESDGPHSLDSVGLYRKGDRCLRLGVTRDNAKQLNHYGYSSYDAYITPTKRLESPRDYKGLKFSTNMAGEDPTISESLFRSPRKYYEILGTNGDMNIQQMQTLVEIYNKTFDPIYVNAEFCCHSCSMSAIDRTMHKMGCNFKDPNYTQFILAKDEHTDSIILDWGEQVTHEECGGKLELVDEGGLSISKCVECGATQNGGWFCHAQPKNILPKSVFHQRLDEAMELQKKKSYVGKTCKGSMKLGSGCGKCEKCKDQMNEKFTNEEVLKLLIKCKDRFGGSELQDYVADGEVEKWFERYLINKNNGEDNN